LDFAKLFIVILLVIVVFCLFRALYFMVSAKGKQQADGVANFLTLRVTFSAVLIAFLVLANYNGWITFHGPHQDPRQVQQIEQNKLMEEKKSASE
jgi:branched-subunit amino acid transport protein AzlD